MDLQYAVHLDPIAGNTDTEIWIFAYHSYLKNLETVNTINLYLSIFSLLIQLAFLAIVVYIFIRCWRNT